MTDRSVNSRPLSGADRLLQLLVLSAFAIAQPIFDILGKNPEFFVIRRSDSIDLFLLSLLLVVAVPAVLYFAEQALSRLPGELAPKAVKLSHILFTSLLLVLVTIPVANKVLAQPATVFALALIVSAACAYLLFTAGGQTFIKVVCPAVLIFPVLFIGDGKISKIAFPKSGSAPVVSAASRPAPTFVIVFDALPLVTLLDANYEFSKERFPNFWALAQNSTWYQNTTTVSSWTQHAVPAILTGKYPDISRRKVPSADDHPQNLFTLFSGSHDIHAFEQVTHLCPDSICNPAREDFGQRFKSLIQDVGIVYLHLVMPKNYAHLLPSIGSSWNNFIGQAVQKGSDKGSWRASGTKGLLKKGDWADDAFLFREYVSSITPGQKPGLYFLHVTFPHVPFRYLPSGKKYQRDLDSRNDIGYTLRWGKNPWPGIQQFQKHMFQLHVADTFIGEFLQKLRQTNLYDQSLVVVTADHGESFMPEEFSRRLGKTNSPDVLLVPLLMKFPGQTQKITSSINAQTTDILPTMAEALGVPLPEAIEGRSLLSSQSGDRTFRRFFDLKGDGKHVKRTLPPAVNGKTALAHQLEVFGNGGIDSLFRIGPRSDLIGKTVKQISAQLISENVTIENLDQFDNVEMDSDYIPALISGNLAAASEANPMGIPVVVSVNDKIVASTYALKERDGWKFSALVPETSFVSGRNRVAAYTLK